MDSTASTVSVSEHALRDYWHPIAFSDEVGGDRPQRVTLLSEPLAVFRTASGRVHCFHDLCAHRGTPLSLGWVEDETLVCAYHGWSYNSEGTCVRIPSIADERPIPGKARVDAYQVVERYGIVWVCLGTPTADIGDFPEYDDPGYRSFIVETEDWSASAARLIENFIDTSHFAWVHPGLLGQRDKPRVPPIQVTEEPGHVNVELEMEVGNAVHKGDTSRIRNEVSLPFTVRQVRTDPDGGKHVVFLAVSPKTPKTLRRFVYKLRNYDLDSTDDSKFIEKSRIVAEQDREIVEQQRPEELPVDLSEELHVRGPDDPAVVYRRALSAVGVDIA